MKFKNLLLLATAILIFSSGAANPPGDYYRLIGREIQIHGPSNLDTLGVALNKKACERMIKALSLKDEELFSMVIKSDDILRIKKNTRIFVADVYLFEGQAKVVIFNGIYKGMSGYIPIEWLLGTSNN
jgi:hypothetical protein